MYSQQKIVEMFNEIAPTYDFLNKILSFGIDKVWRKESINEAMKLLDNNELIIADVACGTGDMIKIWKDIIKKNNLKSRIIGIDPSYGMLNIAKKRFNDVQFYESYAINIPISRDFVDVVSISFGIRNVLEIKKALNEFHRILKKNGLLVILEFTKSHNNSFLKRGVDFYSNKILPNIGGFVSKHKYAYNYLPDSIENFYYIDELSQLIIEAGFDIKIEKQFNFEQVSLIIAKN